MSKWNLSVFYPNNEAWEKELETFPAYIEKLSSFEGKLNDFENFKNFYKLEDEATKLLYKLYAYIHLKSDLNLKDQENSAKNQKLLLMLSQLNQKTAFVSPELIAIGKDKILRFVERDDFLKTYQFSFEKLFFQQQHVLSLAEERIMANFSPIRNIPSQLYQSLAIIDATDEEIEVSTGEKLTVTTSNYRALLPTLEKPEDRQLVFEAVFKRYKNNKTAFANIYNLVLQRMQANVKSRKYESALDSALFGNNIPTSVFHNLKDVAYENNKLIQRYIKIRQKELGLEKYHTYDRFLQIAKDDTKYTYEKGLELFFNSLEGFDDEFVAYQKDAVATGYVDALPQDGKRTGAYSSGVYGYHPFILLNHDDTLDSVFTLAHEAGHSAHTLFSQKNQPMPTAGYTIFVAEIASTFNEHILLDYLINQAKTKNEKVVLIEKAIDGIMATFFRQTLFATYEYEANKLIEQGIPITEKNLSEIMINLYKHYYDIDITEENGKEYVWAYIPHLYHSPFYVYQYATSYSASLKIYEDVKNGNKDAMENYKTLLKSGGNDYPVNQAKKAGADLTQKETFMAVINRFENLVDLLEETLAQK